MDCQKGKEIKKGVQKLKYNKQDKWLAWPAKNCRNKKRIILVTIFSIK